ncbi:hypothetical protein [Spartinivicinus poritis]|uniref:Uncharacterized protein n=1 Tax=Spartinivicinus poritis TaxID=2994640 RepID=A0ABT5UJZ7_9GAMM|nr:hypothetical protein [Spartinivicinus sp. A2-2]MDE1465837.1 hypothetical protein [Spartinivicinus sp. A2-2]
MNTKKLTQLSTQHPRLTVRTLATLMAINDNGHGSIPVNTLPCHH